ncbi:hypothetical protein [Microbacterium sp. LWH12-1.2]|uniref:hypothetical protein n=1 Tax=Microbacterium sp. LWH12-1.2 TaxID=3135259 RepID=UPI003421FBE6
MSERPAAVVCRATTAERLAYVGAAVFVGAFGASMLPSSPAIAVVAGLIAVGVAAMAATGRCAASWIRTSARSSSRAESSTGQDDRPVRVPEKERDIDG